MTLKDIINQLPKAGKTCGWDIDRDSLENWLDHALEKIACDYLEEGDLFAAGLATATQVMTISMTIDGIDWENIRSALEAMEGYLR